MEIMVVATMLLLLVLLGVAVKLYDLKRKREEEAVAAQARVSAHLPLWKGSPLVLEIKGAVPRPELREAAVDVAKREVGRSRSDFRIEDRIAVNPGGLGHAA